MTDIDRTGRANVAWMLVEAADRHGERPAIMDAEETVSFTALRDRAAGFREALQAAGAGPGDRVAILLERGADAAAAFMGTLAAGAVAVIVYEGLRPLQLEHILRHSEARVLITTADLLARLPRPLETSAAVVRADGIDDAARADPVHREDTATAQIIYTSGSTGLPKGVTLSHANLRAGTDAVTRYLGIHGDDRIASLLPFSFDYGLSQLLCALTTGATLVIERSPVPQRIVATLREREVSVLAAVPPLWLQLLRTEAFARRPLPALRVMTNTGGRLPTDAVRRLRAAQPAARLFLMYGLTEAFRSTYLPPEEADRRPDSIGRPIPEARIVVLREDGTRCRPGEVGELVHAGPTVALGYWADPEATARVFRPDPFPPADAPAGARVVFSGDLVRVDDEGFLYFVGRRDRMIKTLGYRVSPDEVVEALHASGEVEEAVVAAEPDELRGERIVACVVMAADGSLDRLRAYCARELPRYLRPARFETRDRLPRTATGKHATPALEGVA